MGFFVTSKSIGNGADLGGVEGGDAIARNWPKPPAPRGGPGGPTSVPSLPTAKSVASLPATGSVIGPRYNARGELIASDLDQLHLNPNIIKRTALDQNGNLIKGRGDKPNQHDILTGSKHDGTAYFSREEGDHTCSNWTSSVDGTGSAQVGHHDRHGGGNTSWTSAHASRGCSQKNLEGTGGAGYLYCFAAD